MDKDIMDEHIDAMIKEIERVDRITKSEEYEDWLAGMLQKHKYISDLEDLYLYGLPKGISQDDADKIGVFNHYFYIKDPSREKEAADNLFCFMPTDKELHFSVKNMPVIMRRKCGCGCYEYSIELEENGDKKYG